jgi:hypothetical protein
LTQTLAPIGGIAHRPTPLPANGTDGIAQFRLESPVTAGTVTITRPSCIGSMFCATVPR